MEMFGNRMLRGIMGAKSFVVCTLSKCACYWGDHIKEQVGDT
jgi:hypothetical protein